MPVDPLVGGAMIGVGSQVLGNIMGINNAQQMNAMQMQGQKDMAVFNKNLQMQLWRDTNYAAQVEEMRKAGLNIGLMYGKGGGGGGTTQIAPGNVSAQSVNNQGGNALQGMAMMSQAKLNNAQIQNIEADTAKKAAEKIEIESRIPTYAKGMQKTDQEIAKMASDIGVNVETVKKILQEIEASKTTQQLTGAQTANIEANTKRIETLTPIEADLMKENWKREVTQNKYLDDKQKAELDNLLQDVINKKAMIEQNDERIDQEQFKKQLESKYPNIMNVMGGTLNQVLTWLTGGRDTNYIQAPQRRR